MCHSLPLINKKNLQGLYCELGNDLNVLVGVFSDYISKWSDHIGSAYILGDYAKVKTNIRALRNFSLLFSAEKLVCMSDQLCSLIQEDIVSDSLVSALLATAQETCNVLIFFIEELKFFVTLDALHDL